VRDVLEKLTLPWCVATSSSPRRAEMSLGLVGLWPLVQGRIFTASEVARGKPAPDLFLHAAARKHADPAKTLVIEDSLTGVQAGLAAGMTVWRFTGGSHMPDDLPQEPPEATPHLRFASFAQFFQIAPEFRRQG
jgi:beta-phosphoglucomutase-like phosphatase (HAD superfamily)